MDRQECNWHCITYIAFTLVQGSELDRSTDVQFTHSIKLHMNNVEVTALCTNRWEIRGLCMCTEAHSQNINKVDAGICPGRQLTLPPTSPVSKSLLMLLMNRWFVTTQGGGPTCLERGWHWEESIDNISVWARKGNSTLLDIIFRAH
jgi:hypothetical protein